MSSSADYGKLKSVVLGVAENYVPHIWGWKNSGISYRSFQFASKIAEKVIPNKIKEEVIEDLTEFASKLEQLGIKVLRPPRDIKIDIHEEEKFFAYGNDFYNMRDLQIVIGDQLLIAAPSCPARINELIRLNSFFLDIANKFNLQIVRARIPSLLRNPVQEFYFTNGDLHLRENEIGGELGGDYSEVWHRLVEGEVLFDAANIARFNDFLLYLVSSTGNRTAFDWLSSIQDIKRKWFQTDVYRSSHIDSTIMPLADDVVLVNSARVNTQNLHECLKDKKVIYFQDVAEIPESEREFNQIRKLAAVKIESLGFHTDLSEMSSPWAGMNVLSLGDDLIAVESRQLKLIKQLETEGFDVMPVRYRHPYTFLGGLHCTTLDLDRS